MRYEVKFMIGFMSLMAIYFFMASLAIEYNCLGIFLMLVLGIPAIFIKKLKIKWNEIKLKLQE